MPTYPEKSRASEMAPDGDIGFIPTSQSVGAGHNDSLNRLPDPNAEWSNEETGAGTDPSMMDSCCAN
jgi:hypothetical protein